MLLSYGFIVMDVKANAILCFLISWKATSGHIWCLLVKFIFFIFFLLKSVEKLNNIIIPKNTNIDVIFKTSENSNTETQWMPQRSSTAFTQSL